MNKTRLGIWRPIILAITLVLSAQLGAASASANSDDAAQVVWTNPNPTSPNDIVRIYKSTGTRKPVVPPGATAGHDPCSWTYPEIWAVDGNGVRVWDLKVDINWCYDGTNVTYYYRNPHMAVGGNWCDLGTVEDSVSSPTTGYTQTFQHHKHHVAQCSWTPWGWIYWQDTYPWIDATVYGSGGSTSNAGT